MGRKIIQVFGVSKCSVIFTPNYKYMDYNLYVLFITFVEGGPIIVKISTLKFSYFIY